MDLYRIALIITIFGGVDFGLIGLIKRDLISLIFGDMSALTRLIYVVIGVAAGYLGAMTFIYNDEKKKS